jgi:hypothetical protein
MNPTAQAATTSSAVVEATTACTGTLGTTSSSGPVVTCPDGRGNDVVKGGGGRDFNFGVR